VWEIDFTSGKSESYSIKSIVWVSLEGISNLSLNLEIMFGKNKTSFEVVFPLITKKLPQSITFIIYLY
jgi:hypothetical protein